MRLGWQLLALGAALLPLAAGAQSWTVVTPPVDVPDARVDHAATRDPVSGVVFVFGGSTAAGTEDDLWIWDPRASGWRELTPTTGRPPARLGHSMVHDPVRDELLVFGGYDGTVFYDDLWAFDLRTRTWAERTPGTSPAARYAQVMVHDAARDRFLMHGGIDATDARLADLWEWDGTAWTQLSPGGPAPPARSDHGAVWDPARGALLLFGGYDGSAVLADTWELDPTVPSWTDRTPGASPPARRFHALAPVPGGALLLSGFDGTARLDDTWVWDGAAGTWTAQITTAGEPQPRTHHALAAHPDGRVFALGGSTLAGNQNDVWQWSSAGGWVERPPGPYAPSAREGATAAWWAPRDRMLLFGGRDAEGLRGDLWLWDPVGGRWMELPVRGTAPAARAHAVFAPVPGSGTVLLFGGEGSGGALGDTWTLDANTYDWSLRSPTTAPPPRRRAASVFDSNTGRVTLFGGRDGAALSDTWVWDEQAGRWDELTPATGPPARDGAVLAPGPQGDELVLFGGNGTSGNKLADTWVWRRQGASWSLQSPTLAPSARQGAVAVYDPARYETILFSGGTDLLATSELWSWDGGDWASVAASGPAAREWSAMVWRSSPPEAWLFGGTDLTTRTNDLWVYRAPTPDADGVDLTPDDGIADSCTIERVRLRVLDAQGRPVRDPAKAQVAVTVTVSAPASSPLITSTDLIGASATPAASVTGTSRSDASTTLEVRLDAADTVTVAVDAPSLPSRSATTTVSFQPSLPDATLSTFSTDRASMRAGEDTAVLTFRPRDGCGVDLGPGRTVTMLTTGGQLGAVTDVGDGTYTATLGTAAGDCPAAPIEVTARILGVPVGPVSVDVYCLELDADSPAAAVAPQALACASFGTFAVVDVVPTGTDGRPMPPGRQVDIVPDPPRLLRGGVTESTDAAGVTTYSLQVGSDRCDDTAAVSIPVTVDGTLLSTRPQVLFTCPPVEPASIGFTTAPTSAPADGITPIAVRVDALDECGNPAFGRAVRLEPLDAASPLEITPAAQTTTDDAGGTGDGAATFEVTTTLPGTFGVRADVDGRTARAEDLLIFTSVGILGLEYRAGLREAVAGQTVTLRAEVVNGYPTPLEDVVITPRSSGLRVVGATDAVDLGDGRYGLGGIPVGATAPFELEAVLRPGFDVASSYLEATFSVTGSPRPGRATSRPVEIRIVETSGGGCECGATGPGAVVPGLLLLTVWALRRRS